ncbi:MAG TPA: GNAT family N-acetyltransferase [Candidatus Cybelea sp.]|jgi:GNAT superfamily N-acetyltransferase|nr:GNAT family N-acetyltransferase [Candidatus Cybelea sp.]
MPGADCTIERAEERDLAALSQLFDAYRQFFAGHREIERSTRFLADRFAAGDSVIFIARKTTEVQGFIQLYPLWSSWHCRRIWFLSDLYVEKSSRKSGVGRRLVERVVRYAHETGAASVMVELPRREPHLKEFYARLGFVPDALFELARYTPA